MLNSIAGILGVGVAASTNSYESIQTVTGNGSSGTITFSSIPSTYKHLQIRCLALGTTNSGSSLTLKLNNDTANNYATHTLYGDGATAASVASTTVNYIRCGAYVYGMSTTYPIISIIDILDYTDTNKNKTVRSLNGTDKNGSGDIDFNSGVWMSTVAVNRIDVTSSAFTTTSHFALYGIKGA